MIEKIGSKFGLVLPYNLRKNRHHSRDLSSTCLLGKKISPHSYYFLHPSKCLKHPLHSIEKVEAMLKPCWINVKIIKIKPVASACGLVMANKTYFFFHIWLVYTISANPIYIYIQFCGYALNVKILCTYLQKYLTGKWSQLS